MTTEDPMPAGDTFDWQSGQLLNKMGKEVFRLPFWVRTIMYVICSLLLPT